MEPVSRSKELEPIPKLSGPPAALRTSHRLMCPRLGFALFAFFSSFKCAQSDDPTLHHI
jgi:hypothetical protein